jgi:hypothetical protein
MKATTTLLHVPKRLAAVLVALKLAKPAAIGKTGKRKAKTLPLLEAQP